MRKSDMQFSELVQGVQSSQADIALHPSWAQGRATFGGLVAALIYKAMTHRLTEPRPVRTLHITFVGPVDASAPLHIETECLREGKAVSTVVGKGLQDGEVKAIIVGSFGHSRDSSIHVLREPVLFEEHPDQVQKLPYIPGVIPEFTSFFDFRYCTPFPFAGSKDQYVKGFIRFEHEHGLIDEAGLIGLVDTWPPTQLPMLSKPAAGSSLNWTIDFVQPFQAFPAEEYLQYRSDIVHADSGYGHASAKLWNMRGDLVAISHQTTTIFG